MILFPSSTEGFLCSFHNIKNGLGDSILIKTTMSAYLPFASTRFKSIDQFRISVHRYAGIGLMYT